MKENTDYYEYNCLGRKFAVTDFLHGNAVPPAGFEIIRLGVSHLAEAVLEKEPDVPTLIAVGAFFLRARGLPLSEYDIDVGGKIRKMRFLDTGTGEIGVNVEKCKLMLSNRTLESEGVTLVFNAVGVGRDTVWLTSVANSESFSPSLLPQLYLKLGGRVCVVSKACEFLSFKSYPSDEAFDTSSALAIFERYAERAVTDGTHTVNFNKINGETFLFSKVTS